MFAAAALVLASTLSWETAVTTELQSNKAFAGKNVQVCVSGECLNVDRGAEPTFPAPVPSSTAAEFALILGVVLKTVPCVPGTDIDVSYKNESTFQEGDINNVEMKVKVSCGGQMSI